MKVSVKLFALVMALVLMMSTMLTGAAAEAVPFEKTIEWDAEYDVVVIGYGLAGAVSAVTAAENGANVLVLEKAPFGKEGGNSRYSAQCVITTEDVEGAKIYFRNLRGQYDNQSEEVIDYMANGLVLVKEWITSRGKNLVTYPFPEYPEMEGASAIKGGLIDGLGFNAELLKTAYTEVEKHSDVVDIWHETPGVRLIQDKATGVVHGVVAENNGEQINIRAKNGVVMAMGGFENNDEMLENYCQLSNAYSKGAHYNTGDGVKMAIDVGAELWHMSTLSGPDVNFVNPDSGVASGYALTHSKASPGAFTAFATEAMIVVGSDGRRYLDETFFPRHGHGYVAGDWFSLLIPDDSWCVFDESARLAKPAYPSWSEGMVDEIEKGWIIKADTLEELAAMMGVPAENLTSEVEKYNGYCETGVDIEFGKGPGHVPESLKALTQAPYYAFPLRATLTNTQGGAKRNTNCEVISIWGEPIPNLYSAGEFGSFHTDIYNGGGNLSECIYTGVTAGENAAKAKDNTLDESLLTGEAVDFTAKEQVFETASNELIGVGSGIGGDLVVKVTMDGEKIAAIEILSHNETPGFRDPAFEQMPGRIIEAQSTEVDTVSGSTNTSRGILQAVADALSQAK